MVVEGANSSDLPRAQPCTWTTYGNDKALASVIIPAYRMAAFLPEALRSIETQTYVRWEAMIVDDGGPEDGTADIVARFAARNAGHRIEYIRHETNRGVSAARNTAIRHAHGTVLAFLDPDDYWEAHHLDLLLRTLATGRCAVVTSQARIVRTGVAAHGRAVRKATETEVEQFPASLAYRNFLTLSATVVARDALDAAGGFDETPAIQHAEDYDLWIRLAQAGARFCFLRDITCDYRKHPAAATSDPEKDRQRREAVYRKHPLFFIDGLRQLLEAEVQRGERARGRAPAAWVPRAVRAAIPQRARKVVLGLFALRGARMRSEGRGG